MANGLMSNFGQEFAGGLRRTGDRFVGHVGTLAALLGLDSPYWEAARQNRARARADSRGLGIATRIGEEGLAALLPLFLAKVGLGGAGAWAGRHKLGVGLAGAAAAGRLALRQMRESKAEKTLNDRGQLAPAANLSKEQVQQLVQQIVTGQLAGGAGAGVEVGGEEGYGPNEEFSQLMAIANAREQPQGRDLGWGYRPTEYGLIPRTASDVIMRAPLSASRGQRERQRRLDADMAGRYAADTGALRGLAAGVASAGNGQQYDARMRRLEARAAIEPYQQRLLAERAQRGLQGKYMTQVAALLRQGMASEDPAAARAAIQQLDALHRGQLGNPETEYGW